MIIHWNADPLFFSFGGIYIRWYGLFFAGAFMAGLYMMHRIYDREGISQDELKNLFTYVIVGTLIGARLGHCLFYDPVYYITHPVKILKVWEGGLASHGGALGIVIALAFFTRRHDRHLDWLLDRLAIPGAFGGALIRIGNFMNSEIIGLPTGGDWGVVFERLDSLPRHPVQLYESLAYMSIFVLLVLIYRIRGHKLADGYLAGLFLVAIFTVRFLLEYVKTPQAEFAVYWGVHMGQALSIPFIAAGIALLIRGMNDRAVR
ncbi:MAG: prolipoprotein diacylglyceryl transferase [Desulfobacterales bacterium]|nr:prolipoprotein diacylglyceryl transferase [Desulfobacterales bacterium]